MLGILHVTSWLLRFLILPGTISVSLVGFKLHARTPGTYDMMGVLVVCEAKEASMCLWLWVEYPSDIHDVSVRFCNGFCPFRIRAQ